MREKITMLLVAGLATFTCAPARGAEQAAAAGLRTDDGSLIRAVQGELLGETDIPYQSVHVSVIDGIVSLTGRVDTVLDRRRVAELARTTSGVRGVVNRIDTEPSSRSDDELRDVEAVDVAGLSVDGWRGADPQGAAPAPTDAEVRQAVADSLRYDPRLDSCGVAVAVRDGAVTLSGLVRSEAARGAAEEDALNAVGVRTVDNRLRAGRPAPAPKRAALDGDRKEQR